jgi:hypothetical protein
MNANDSISWSTLLAGWIHFAQTAVALPKNEEGQRWRDSVSPLISLHAHAMALGEIEKVDFEERPLAMDKSELGIKEQIVSLNQIWRSEPMPQTVIELIEDAKEAWEMALHEGVVWVVSSERFLAFHPAHLAEELLDAGFIGEVLVASPGMEMFKGAPVLIARENSGGQPADDILKIIERYLGMCDGKVNTPAVIRPICQVYRQFDFLNGGAAKDVVASILSDLQSGQPLLIPVVSGGASGALPLPPKLSKPLDPVQVVWMEDENRDDQESES